MKPPRLGRLHVQFRNGQKPLYHEVYLASMETHDDLRVLTYTKSDRINVAIPVEAILYWQVAEIDKSEIADARLLPPSEPQPHQRDPDQDWPVNTKY